MKKIQPTPTTIELTRKYDGETIENKIRRIVLNKEPIKDGAPLIFTERKDGVQPQYDIRTDRFEIAVEAMDKVSKSNLAKRQMRLEKSVQEPTENVGEPKSIRTDNAKSADN